MSPDDPIYSDEEEGEKIAAFLKNNLDFERVEIEDDGVVFYYKDIEEPFVPEEFVSGSHTRQIMDQLRWDLGFKY